MKQETIREYRRKLSPLLPRYLRESGKGYRDGMILCPRCGKAAFFWEGRGPYGEGIWRCPDCGSTGDTLDYVMLEIPSYDEAAAVRHIHRTLGMKITTLETVSAGELLRMQLPKQQFLVEGLLGRGLYILSGASKIGKSWLVLDLADKVSRGAPFFGRRTRACPVLYVSLEDTRARLQNRLSLVTEGEPGPVHLATEAELMNHGFEEQLSGFLQEQPKVKLVIIDTLQKIRELGRDNYSYAGDYAVTGALKSLADRFDLTMLLVHHNRKQDSLDPVDRISGTNGISGGVDGFWLLNKRARNSGDAILTVGGRDLEDQNLDLHFDKDRKRWACLGEHSEGVTFTSELLEKTAELAQKGWQGNATQLQAALDLPETDPCILMRQLNAAEDVLEKKYGVTLERSRSSRGRSVSLYRSREAVTDDASDRYRGGTDAS